MAGAALYDDITLPEHNIFVGEDHRQFAFEYDRGEMRGVEIYASKGSRVIVVQGSWAIGPPLNDASLKQFQQLAKSALDKLP